MALVNLIEAKIGIAIFLALFPIFMILYAFNGPARDLFSGWLKIVLGLIFLQILTVLTLLFIIAITVGDSLTTEGAANIVGDKGFYFMLTIFLVVAALFMKKVPEYAAQLTGGVTAGGHAQVRAMLDTSSGRMTSRGAKKVLGKAGSGIGKVWGKVTGRGKVSRG